VIHRPVMQLAVAIWTHHFLKAYEFVAYPANNQPIQKRIGISVFNASVLNAASENWFDKENNLELRQSSPCSG